MAYRMAATDSVSSWSPQECAQPPPPMAHAPKPTRVRCMSVQPSLTVGSEVVIVVLLVVDRARALPALLDRAGMIGFSRGGNRLIGQGWAGGAQPGRCGRGKSACVTRR